MLNLPIVGLPVSKQQVSEPVARRQGQNLLLHLNHCPLSAAFKEQQKKRRKKATLKGKHKNRTSTDYTPQSLKKEKKEEVPSFHCYGDRSLGERRAAITHDIPERTTFFLGSRRCTLLSPSEATGWVRSAVMRGQTFGVTAGVQLVVSQWTPPFSALSPCAPRLSAPGTQPIDVCDGEHVLTVL